MKVVLCCIGAGSAKPADEPRVSFTVVYSDGSREDGISGEELREPVDSSPATTTVCDKGDEHSAQPSEARTVVVRQQELAQQTQEEQEAKHAAAQGPLTTASGVDDTTKRQSLGVDVLARSRTFLAGGSALYARVDQAMGAIQRDALGATAAVEADWQHYRSQHDVLGDRLSDFARSFTAETWTAAANSARSVMAGLMEGITLPTPQLAISSQNSRQLLSATLHREKLRRQQQWCEQWHSIQEHRLRRDDQGGVPDGSTPSATASFHSFNCSCHLGCLVWEGTSPLDRSDICRGSDRTATIIGVAGGVDSASDVTASQPQLRQESSIDWCTQVHAVCQGDQPGWASMLEEFVRLHSF